jgi:hypothetical protein
MGSIAETAIGQGVKVQQLSSSLNSELTNMSVASKPDARVATRPRTTVLKGDACVPTFWSLPFA